jgi:hypothetical protein
MNEQNLMEVYRYMQSRGLSDTAIYAMLGNIAVESAYSFDPSIEQQGERKDPAYGLFQFDPRGGLYKPYMDYVKQTEDQDPASVKHQLDFMIDSVQGTYKPGAEYMGFGNVKKVNEAFQGDDVEAATKLFSDKILRPGKPHLNRRIASANTARDLISANLASGVGEVIAMEDPSQTAEEAGQRGSFLEGLRGLYQLYKRDFGSEAEPVAQQAMPTDEEIVNVLEEQNNFEPVSKDELLRGEEELMGYKGFM